MDKGKEPTTTEPKSQNPWESYEPRGEIQGDLHVEYYGGEVQVFRNMKLFHHDGDGISFYYQLDMGAWAMLRIPNRHIRDYEVIKGG